MGGHSCNSGSERGDVASLLSAQDLGWKIPVLSGSGPSSDGPPLLSGGADGFWAHEGLAAALICSLGKLHALELIAHVLLVHSLGSRSISYTFSVSRSLLPGD